MAEIGRNDPCHCGSGKKFKKCHLEKDGIRDQEIRQEAALNAAKVASANAAKEEKNKTKSETSEPKKGWFRNVVGKVGFVKNTTMQRNIPQNKGG